MFTEKRKLLSQNFLFKPDFVRRLVALSCIDSNSTVLEIGSGGGVITKRLLEVAKKVMAVEIDSVLAEYLQSRFKQEDKLEVHNADFLDFKLPKCEYVVFANIPFRRTADIVKKLLAVGNESMTDAYLVMQEDAAYKFMINKKVNSMLSVLYYPWYEIEVVHRFRRSDFIPRPKVDVAFVHFKRRATPLIPDKKRSLYQDYVAYWFNRRRGSSKVNPQRWLKMFGESTVTKGVKGAYKKLIKQQGELEKVHRTRKDKRWRDFS